MFLIAYKITGCFFLYESINYAIPGLGISYFLLLKAYSILEQYILFLKVPKHENFGLGVYLVFKSTVTTIKEKIEIFQQQKDWF